LADDRIDGETREHHHQRHAAANLCSRCPVTGAVSESLD